MSARESAEPKIVPFSKFLLLPPDKSLCQTCAIDHAPEEPHNKDSLFYGYSFRLREAQEGREERWPTWEDAMAHCAPDVQQAWRVELRKHGVDI